MEAGIVTPEERQSIMALVIAPGRDRTGTEQVLRIPGPEAEQALTALLDSDSEIVREGAEAQLARRAIQ